MSEHIILKESITSIADTVHLFRLYDTIKLEAFISNAVK